MTTHLFVTWPLAASPNSSPVVRWLLDPVGQLLEVTDRLWDTHGLALLWLAPLPFIMLFLITVARRLVGDWRAARLQDGARLIEIRPPAQVERDSAEKFWAAAAGLLRRRRWWQPRPHLVWEYRWSPGRLLIGVCVPGPVAPRLVERAIHAAWPGARTRTLTPPPPPLAPIEGPQARAHRAMTVTGGYMRLARPEWFSLQTEHQTDPLRALLGAAAELGGEETAIVQLLTRPARGRRLARCRQAARVLRTGRSVTLGQQLFDLVDPTVRTTTRTTTPLDPTRQADSKEILAKAAQAGWETQVRYGVATHTGHDPAGRVVSRAHALAAAYGVYHAGNQRLVPRRLRNVTVALTERRLDRGDLLSAGELAALAHLPLDAAVVGLRRAGATSVPPAPSIRGDGARPDGVASVKVLGDADGGPRRPIALGVAEARQHLHVMGSTGVGKSTLAGNLVLQDVAAGRGVVLIDPRGDLVHDLLERLPADTPLALLDPADREAPPAINMLEGADPVTQELAVDHLLSILGRIFANAWGPMTSDVLGAACRTALATGPATLADIPRLLTDPVFRRPRVDVLARQSTRHELRGFWRWFEQLTANGQARAAGPALSRLRTVLGRSYVRDVVGSTTSSIDMRTVLDGGVLLARLPKGALGDEGSRLLGAMVISMVWQAAIERVRLGEEARVDTSLYVDEAHHHLHLPYSYAEMLAEARGYRVSLTLSHQNLSQLPRELREAVSANARSKCWFAMSPEDAHVLARHVHPTLTEYDLVHLGAYQAAARVVVDDVEMAACTLTTRPLPPPVPGRAETLRVAARQEHGRTHHDRQAEQRRRDTGQDDPRQQPPNPPANDPRRHPRP